MADDNANIRRQQKELDELNKTIERQNRLVQEQSQQKKEYLDVMGEEARHLKVVLQAQEKLRIAEEMGLESVQALREEYEGYKTELSEVDQAIIAKTESMKKLRDEIDKNRTKQEKQLKALEAEKKALDESNKAYTERVKKLKGMGSALDQVTKSNLSSLATFKGLASAMIDFAYAQQNAQVQIARTTGYGTAFKDNLHAMMLENKALGLTLEENTKILGSLSTGMSRFNALSDKQQNSIAAVGARFMRLGVDTQAFGEVMERLNYSFGVTGAAAIDAAGDIEALSDRIGRPIGSVVEDLNSLGPELSRFGQAGLKVFEKLATQARELGLSVKQAFDMSELFDTFEGAANVAGRLNAQLGLQLNSVQLMKASSEERIDLLRAEFQLQGKNINTMGRRQQQMIASILQTDVESARKLLGDRTDISQFQKEKTAEKRMDDFITAQEKMNGLMQQLMMPVAHILAGLMEGMMNLVGIMANYAPQALKALAGIATAIFLTSAMRGGGMLNRTGAGGPKSGGPKFTPTGSTGRFTAGNRRLPGGGPSKIPTPSAGGGFSNLAKFGGVATGGVLAGAFDAYSEYSQTKDAGRAAKVGGASAIGFASGAGLGLLTGPLAPIMSPLLGVAGSMLAASLSRSVMGEPKQQKNEYDPQAEIKKITQQARKQAQNQNKPTPVHISFEVGGKNWANKTVEVFNGATSPIG